MSTGDWILLSLYFLTVITVGAWGLNCYVMAFLSRRHFRRELQRTLSIVTDFWAGHPDASDLPMVTVQLPVFNERFVVGRLLHAVTQLDWPADRLEIQLLDDSTDDTTDICRELVHHYRRETGLDIVYLHRPHRDGFKAGALEAGMQVATGELIAIFDADFVPAADFLRRTVPFFAEPRVGMVQTRWGHFNAEWSLLTRMQAIAIDGHFGIEQAARRGAGLYLNFNGTAGVWRRACIDDAGGWQHDTLTEDLDLSYRAQLRGWQMEFAPAVEAPAELPDTVAAFKSQQRRWAKGCSQTLRKLGWRVERAPLPLFTRLQALLHLGHYFIHPLMLLSALLVWPLLPVWQHSTLHAAAFWAMFVFTLVCTIGPSSMYMAGQRALRRGWRRKIFMLPVLMVVGTGIAVSNTRAVLEGLLGIRSGFVRTPKHSLTVRSDATSARAARAYRLPFDGMLPVELFMCGWCLLAAIDYWKAGMGIYSPYLAIYTLGFGTMALASISDAVRAVARRHATVADPPPSDLFPAAERSWRAAVDAWRPADSAAMQAVQTTLPPMPQPNPTAAHPVLVDQRVPTTAG